MATSPDTDGDGLTRDARQVLAAQDQLISRSQALEAGLSKATIRWRSGRSWRVVLPRTYLVGRQSPTPRQREIAALLWAGRRAYLTGRAGAAFHGLSVPRSGRVVMLVPAPGSSRRNGFAEVRRTLVDDCGIVTRGPLRYASPARSVVDAALTFARPEDRTALVVEAVQRGIADLESIHEWTCRIRTREAAGLLDALELAGTGVWSLPEGELLALMTTSSMLPSPWANPSLTTEEGRPLLTPDLWLDDVGMAVLVHSRLHHASGDQWISTVEKDGDLTRVGVVVAGVTPTGMRRDPAGVLRRLEETYEIARHRPRPRVVAVERPLWAPSTSRPTAS